jgi:CubicO group peptidase (beta-lactamase class C family)
MRYRNAWLIALALCHAPHLGAQADRVDRFIEDRMRAQRIPALSLAVIKDGKTIKAAGYGVADRKLQTPATPETVYKIGSVSKQFVATGIMLLVQDGKLRLDDPVSRFLEGTPSSWSRITIRHLLTHTSGIVREAPGYDWTAQPDAKVVTGAYPVPLRFQPGEKWEYSNVPYFALAEVIHKVSGQLWDAFLIEKVFKPLGMNSTRPTNTKEPLANRAAGYSDNDKLLDAVEWTGLRPSGAFLSTVLDLAKWDAALDTNRILSESSRRQMWTPVALNDGTTYPYGFGWQLDPHNGHRQVHHGGGIPGFGAQFAKFPDNRLTIIAIVNLDDNALEEIVAGVAALYLPAKTPAGPR